jgi:hypothetical protein
MDDLDASRTPLNISARGVVFLVMYVACFLEQLKTGAGPFFVGRAFFNSLYSVKKSSITQIP